MESVLDAQIARLQAVAALDDPQSPYPAAGASCLPPAAPAALISIPSYVVTRGQTKIACQSPEARQWAWPTPSVPQICEKRLGVAFCGKTVKKYEQGCCRGDCWGCEDHLRTRTALKFKRESITPHLAGRALCYTITTVPEHLRQAAADFGTWSTWTKRFLKLLEERLGLVFGWVRSDPAGKCKEAEKSGEYCDCSHCAKWHPHLNILWVRENGRGHLTEAELWLLKSLWAEVIGAEHVWDGDALRPVVSCWHKWVPDPSTLQGEARERAEGKLWHLYRYQGRKWPAWQKTAKRFLRIRPFGKFPAKALTEEKAEAKMRQLYSELRTAQETPEPKLETEIAALEASLAAANSAGHSKIAKVLEKRIASKRRRLKVNKIQRKIDKLRTPKVCRCGCGVTRRPEPAPVCDCCGERIRCMPVLDEEEAEHWIREGPEAVKAEIRRRRKEGDKNGREPFEAQLVREMVEPAVGLFQEVIGG